MKLLALIFIQLQKKEHLDQGGQRINALHAHETLSVFVLPVLLMIFHYKAL